MSLNEFSGKKQSTGDIVGTVERLSIDRILCPVDFSEFSRRAIHYALSLARHFGAQLYVQHTAEIPQALFRAEAEPSAVQAWRHQLPRLEQDLAQLLKENGASVSEARIAVNEGTALDRILETISNQRVDLVVMGTHGRTGMSRLMLGSVAEGVIHNSRCPVLVISRPEKEIVDPLAPDTVQIKRLLLATDFSAHSDRALAYALKWACEWAATVVVFHAVPDVPPSTRGIVDLFPEYNPYFEQQVANAWATILHVIPEPVQQWCEVKYEVRHGNAKDEILKAAEEKNADLIILGARGSGISGAPWGSVSSGVVRAGRFPVLVVR